MRFTRRLRSRGQLEQALGDGHARYVHVTGRGAPLLSMGWECGCVATEAGQETFNFIPCDDHYRARTLCRVRQRDGERDAALTAAVAAVRDRPTV